MVYLNTDNKLYFCNGTTWQNLVPDANTNPWNTTGTAIYNGNTGNVGIGEPNPLNAKLEVSGAVNGQVALFKSVSGVSIDGSSAPSIGFNYNNGNAISAGAGSLLSFNPALNGGAGTLNLDFYKTKTAGSLFTLPKNILKFQDFTAFGLGYWLDINNIPDSRTNISDRMYSKSNGNMNLVPIGAIYFKVTDLDNGSNATTLIRDVGQNANLYQSRYSFSVQQGDLTTNGRMNLILNLDFITKGYQDIFIVGSPNVSNEGEKTLDLFARFLPQTVGVPDRIQIWYGSSLLSHATSVFGTLLVYGTKSD
jgi:hypothetical protein